MSNEPTMRVIRPRTDILLSALLLVFSFWVFRRAPIQQAGDSRYTILLAENLLRHHDFSLDRYDLPESDYRIQSAGGHRYYYFPPGTSLLSVPFVAAMDVRGASAVRRDGSYNVAGELEQDARLAAGLMASFSALVYIAARLLLPIGWSVTIACVSAFGTQVFSTASRSMWSDTWGIVLVTLAVFLLLRSSVVRDRGHPIMIASLEALSYIVRPTNSIVLMGTALYLVVTNRKAAWQFILTVGLWLGIFSFYSWVHFRTFLPDYFAGNRLSFEAPWPALIGNLISPSRGLFIYVPATLAIGVALCRYGRGARFWPLTALSMFVILCQFVVLSGFGHWWGGHSYGARLTTNLVPWFVLLAIIGVDALRRGTHERSRRWSDVGLAIVMALLCVASVLINAVGAFSEDANMWNMIPHNIDADPKRLWSWRRPQFLAPLIEPEGPFLPLPSEGLRVGAQDANDYLGLGWTHGERTFRWTDGSTGASIRFSLPTIEPGVVELELRPYLGAGRIREQRLIVSMNGTEVGNAVLRAGDFANYRFVVPSGVGKAQNWLRLRTPDAASPADIEGASDRRRLGVAVALVRWDELTR